MRVLSRPSAPGLPPLPDRVRHWRVEARAPRRRHSRHSRHSGAARRRAAPRAARQPALLSRYPKRYHEQLARVLFSGSKMYTEH